MFENATRLCAVAAAPACNVTASVIDRGPSGTNVRKTPGGAVAAAQRTTCA